MSETITVWIIHFPETSEEEAYTVTMASAPPAETVALVRDAGGSIIQFELPAESFSDPYELDYEDDDGKEKIRLTFDINEDEEALDTSGIDFESITNGEELAAALQELEYIKTAVFDNGVLTLTAMDGYDLGVDGEKAFGEYGDYTQSNGDTLVVSITDVEAGDVMVSNLTIAEKILETYFEFYAPITYTIQQDSDPIVVTDTAWYRLNSGDGSIISREEHGVAVSSYDMRFLREGHDGYNYYISEGPGGDEAVYKINGNLSPSLFVEDSDIGSSYDYALSDSSGNVYISSGIKSSFLNYIKVYSSSGSLLLTINFEGVNEGFAVTPAGVIYIVTYNGELVKIVSGEASWRIAFSTSSYDSAFTYPLIDVCNDGGVVFCWRSSNLVSGYDYTIYKYSSDGNKEWEYTAVGASTGQLTSLTAYGNGVILSYSDQPSWDYNRKEIYIDADGEVVFDESVYAADIDDQVGVTKNYGWYYGW